MRSLIVITVLALIAMLESPGALAKEAPLPPGFAYVEDQVPDLRVDLRYRGSDNFMGRPIDGYQGERLILTRLAASALAEVQGQLRPLGLGLLVYDGYRPQRAVDHFVRWGHDLEDQVNKASYYPDVDKSRLFAEGYIAERSGHSRGSTLDLTLIDSRSGEPLDMGTPWDHFGPESWPDYEGVTAQQRANRLLLRTLMLAAGFAPYEQEWWHFTLAEEPFPDTWFDFPVQ